MNPPAPATPAVPVTPGTRAARRRQRFARSWTPVDRTLLQVEDLHVEFRTRDGVARAINGVSFELHQDETLAVLGESGSGKSVTAQAVMGILDTPPAFVTGGAVKYCGTDLLTLDENVMQTVRGAEISMIFQDALSSLNPVFTVGWQIAEMFRVHRGMNRRDAEEQAVRLMERVRIPAARERVHNYPHQFSGGMRQRIMIAMAIALDPHVLIADEPTTALDVTVQAQIMELLKELQVESHMGLILITHDLGVVADVADRIAVMYAGRLVEKADVFDLYRDPAHPYTLGLLESIPRLDQQGERLNAIGGLPPNLTRIPAGCPFHPRCRFGTDVCRVGEPPALLDVGRGRRVACHHYDQVLGQGLLEADQRSEESTR
ncbi:ABC transporter ATP-binding protein [Raineyella sp. W15-4]|uniref:ABC transporter ATP-binding protein n=1 Tax=Raineyella sp. W15-4 TaxID=3081651 RepID=UPI0039899D63